MKYDNVSFSKDGHKAFKALPEQEQISYLSERLSPKNPLRAAKLLGYEYISSGVDTKSVENKPDRTTSKGNGTGGEGRKSGATESKD